MTDHPKQTETLQPIIDQDPEVPESAVLVVCLPTEQQEDRPNCQPVTTQTLVPSLLVNELEATVPAYTKGVTVRLNMRRGQTLNHTLAYFQLSPKDYNFTLSPELEMRIAEGGPQLIDITPFDQALQALDQMPTLANLLVVRSWTAADTALCLTTIIGYALSLCLSFILYKRINGMQELVGRCTAAFPRMFKRHPGKQGAPTEPTLIEIDTLPVHYCTEVE
ncbi:hypothetical protein Q8A67_024283 [Cirrhinus molitorella]|uniref:Uncharacterized protein n=1 Tax=Cirrhinus molitorella TaxID=172907 RepID=A0AA88P3Y8_9TELE|nr:hypothetical protein Q8A67_024283 [Cirrhinus molitorella]